MRRKRYAYVLAIFLVAIGSVGIAACSSSQSSTARQQFQPLDGGVDSGNVDGVNDAGGPTRITKAADDAYIPLHDGSVPFGWRPPSYRRQRNSEIAEKEWGLTLTQDEKDILDACPRQPLSKNVPDRDCKKDDQCGDGICDRGHCSPIYTCILYPGAPCKTDEHCRGLCMDGRCRSCLSDAECQRSMGNPYAACDDPGQHPPGRSCTAGDSKPPPEELKAMCDAAPANKKPPYCKTP